MLSRTFECFEIRSTLLVCAETVDSTSLPVTPVGNIFQSLVIVSVLEILSADETISARRIHEIVHQNGSRRSVLASPSSRYRTAQGLRIDSRRLRPGKLN